MVSGMFLFSEALINGERRVERGRVLSLVPSYIEMSLAVRRCWLDRTIIPSYLE